ncbi:MAG: esterase family protein [Bacteroidales bacterium]|nr:esterase family protein [Bacteroidales bacterium]
MKKTILLLAAVLAFLPARAGKIVTDSLSSRVLGATLKYNVYLPDGYGESRGRYPVVYLLHGLSDDYSAWKDKGNMRLVADELMRSGEACPMVIVMPGAGNSDIHNVQSGYFNMPGWSYEDFFFRELLPSVEKKYRCGGNKGRRAVMGLSMGGGGSVVYCQRHPDMFSSCYAMSPWLDEKNAEVRGDNDRKDKLYIVCNAVREHSAIDFIAGADESVLKKLRTVAWFIDCGDDDFLLHLSMDFYLKMRDAGVPAQLRVRDGVHNWEYWHLALRMALPFASRNFEKK